MIKWRLVSLIDGVSGLVLCSGNPEPGARWIWRGPTLGEFGIDKAAERAAASAADRKLLAAASDSVSDQAPLDERPDDGLDFLDLLPRRRLLWNALLSDVFNCKYTSTKMVSDQ